MRRFNIRLLIGQPIKHFQTSVPMTNQLLHMPVFLCVAELSGNYYGITVFVGEQKHQSNHTQTQQDLSIMQGTFISPHHHHQ